MRLIDADTLMEIYMDRLSLVADRYSPDSSECGILSGAMKLLDEQPTIEPERKTGRWMEKNVIHEVESSSPIDEWQSAKCSVCGKYHTTPYLYYFDDYSFCPNCGADMRGEQP